MNDQNKNLINSASNVLKMFFIVVETVSNIYCNKFISTLIKEKNGVRLQILKGTLYLY